MKQFWAEQKLGIAIALFKIATLSIGFAILTILQNH